MVIRVLLLSESSHRSDSYPCLLEGVSYKTVLDYYVIYVFAINPDSCFAFAIGQLPAKTKTMPGTNGD
jgi:hypothetical protein